MTIDDLKEKVAKAEEKVAKILAKISKHKSQLNKKIAIVDKILEQNSINIKYEDVKSDNNWIYDYKQSSFYQELSWAIYDIHSKEDDIKNSEKQLAEAQQILKNWQEKLRLEEVKIQYIQDSVPQVIKDFLLNWKMQVSRYYNNKRYTFVEDRLQYQRDLNKAYFEYILENREVILNNFYKNTFSEEYDPNESYKHMISYKYLNQCKRVKIITDAFERQYDAFFMQFYRNKFDNDWLDKQLTEEMNAKLIDLMIRVSKVTGEITDASGLKIQNDNLNGFITGKDGKAHVETIGAAGYNIMRFHYRTLIKPIRTK